MTKPAGAAAIVAVLAAAALTACDRTTDSSVGQKLDHAVQRTEQSLADAGEKTRETLRENAPTVEQKLSSAGRKIEEAGEKTVDRTKEAVHDVQSHDAPSSGNASSAGNVSTASTGSSSSSDLMITASIKADLVKDPDLSALKIDVDTKDGVVTLNGLASDEAGKQRAEHMAQSVKGVREVHNYLTLKRG